MGGSSGGGGHTPVEAPESGRSKQQVKIVEVISEGEIQGLVDGVKTVFLDNTPIQNADNSYNFSNVEAQGRIGSQDQTIFEGFNTTEKEVNVGTEVKKTTPLTRTITDAQVNRIRLTLGVSSLFKQEDNGDTNGASVDLKITVGSQVYMLNFNGKYSSQFLKNMVIENLPAVPFTIKVERAQADSTSQRLQNKTLWASYTEIIDTQFAYPNTALVGIKFDSEYFSQIPNRTYEIYGIKVNVPSNYNPATRQYTGLWDGTFKIAYTDNPAWVLMDIVTNKRYGLGQRLGEFGADKWALYQVAQYCDQLVPDGFGNKEPRFTCNVWLTEQSSSYDVINDICSIFRAMPVWNGQELTVIMDRPADPVWTYTNANVMGGFSRQYSAMKARHNAVQVEHQDKANSYQTTIEYVSNDEAIRKYGLNLKKVKAFGCTSRGQAYRTGRWILETEQRETETITFTVGAEGLMHIPGDIIRVADTQYAGANIGGRVKAVNGHNVTLDREIEISGNSYFQYFNAQAKATQIKISSVKGNIITLDSIPKDLAEMGVWSLTTATITSRLYRAMGISENDDGSYTITALQHEPQKEAIVDNGASFEAINSTLINLPKVEHLDIGIDGDNIKFGWQTSSGIGTLTYDVKILKGSNLYRLEKGLTSPEFSLDGLPNGEYVVVILAKNASGQVVSEKTQSFTIDKPPVPTNVRVTGGLSEITLEWDWVNEATQTEIFASERNEIRTAQKVAKVTARIFSHQVGAKQIRYYWLRHVRGQNLGPFYQEQGLKGESGADIDAELATLNEKLSQNIIEDIIDTALPARNLELVKTVSTLNLNEFIGYNQVHNTADGKLYIWNGTAYTTDKSEVLASDIKGIIGANQIAKIPTTQLQGTLSANQIAANAIGTNHLQSNVITADKMAANSVSTAALQAGAVRANHVAAGELTADKLAIGLGGNLLYNPIFANDKDGWSTNNGNGNFHQYVSSYSVTTQGSSNAAYRMVTLPNENNVLAAGVANGSGSHWAHFAIQSVNLIPGKRYCFSAYLDAWRCAANLRVESLDGNGGYTGFIGETKPQGRSIADYTQTGSFRKGLSTCDRPFIFFTAPESGQVSVIGSIRAINSNGESFDVHFARPMLEECTQYTKAPSAWVNAGVTSIHGGSIVTNTITTQQLAANSVTANELVAGVVNAKHIAANSVSATHIVTKSLTADKLNISSLSAISANLGTVTAGSININNRFKVSSTGTVEMRGNSSNVGMVMNNDAIIVYDASGRVRVKIGKLS